MKSIVFINEDYFPSKTAGGSAKSIRLLSNFLNLKNFKTEIYTSYTQLKNHKNKFQTIFCLNSVFGKTNRLCLFYLIFMGYSNSIIYIPRGEFSKGALSNRLVLKNLYVIFLYFLDKICKIRWIATSEEEKITLLKKINPKRLSICRNLINTNVKITNNTNSKDIVSIGRLEKKKNQIWLDNLNYKIDLYGAKSRESNYISMIESSNFLNYYGNIDPSEMNKIYSGYKVNLLPTKNENFGHVIIESILHGLPVIVSKNTPWTKLINTNKFGYAISMDKSKWKTCINKILENHKLYRSSCLNSKKIFEEINEEIKSEWIEVIKKY